MTIQRMIELLAFERKCVESAGECDRNCAECNLVQDTDELLDMYNEVILLLKAQEAVEPEPKEVIYNDVHRLVYCPSCYNRLAGLTYSGAVALETEETPNYCWMCGRAVKW